jgi:redox-sensitive bicupin YhaK (pirin superfamily)
LRSKRLETSVGALGQNRTMSNLEDKPDEVVCEESGGARGGIEVLEPREVPLGGPRAMTVRRTLPQRERSLIGAWCFLDHYGPDDIADTGGMSVAPHPHTGLQTVSWLFTGEVEHRDSAGHHAMVRPGELNLMTAGHGISHSEVSTPDTTVLHGAQLWVALPAAARDDPPAFDHYAPDPVSGEGWEARVFLGSLLGSSSPVSTATPLLGVELRLAAGTELHLDVDPSFEHGVLVDTGVVSVGDVETKQHELAYVPPGSQRLTVEAVADARLLLLGGPPFGEAIVMWWNFVGRSHEEIVGFREEWMAQLLDDGSYADGRFGVPTGNDLPPIPAPVLPNARLKERR